jgi:hypothetical protein
MSESMPVFDADAYKRTQHDQWNEDAAAWNRWGQHSRPGSVA